ncbi:hypothetical protein [Frankia gtarii]|uniref:hypothetical protein n=1 Tax=Frankia gtarii TaxID=2950102 RepID=UPI0021C0884B|nr:hypothetical protein [Frankia gtarii]
MVLEIPGGDQSRAATGGPLPGLAPSESDEGDDGPAGAMSELRDALIRVTD